MSNGNDAGAQVSINPPDKWPFFDGQLAAQSKRQRGSNAPCYWPARQRENPVT
jgi:hypothetical protein